ncbi:MAG: hypothetical protein ACM3SS_24525 [Rhodospirillaceae bacterium]
MNLAKTIGVLCFAVIAGASIDAVARGSGSGHHGSSIGPGTGSSHSSHSVRGYTRKDGTYVAPHRQSDPDKNFNNNWSTKGNQNPYTGKEGTQLDPPTKP